MKISIMQEYTGGRIALRPQADREPQGCFAKNKPLHAAHSFGFFFVSEGDEISNLKLVDDIFKILEFLESKWI
jgi:myo-inositol-hexaphosphate 3-phosphohydrolase